MPGTSPERRRHRIHARRRAELARSQVRVGLQPRQCDRAGHRGWGGPDCGRRKRPDLFWALRGGGGGYAIVTALHLELLPVAEAYAGAALPVRAGSGGGARYRDWAASAPEEAASMVRMLNLPPIPDIPEPMRGQKLLAISGASSAAEEEGEKASRRCGRSASPVMDTFAQMPATGLTRIAMDPEPPVPGLGHHRVINELPDEAIDAFVRGRRAGFGFASAARRAPPPRGRACPSRRERRCARQARRRVRDARHRDADGPGDAGADRRPAGQALRRDGALGRRRRLLQLRRACQRRRGDPAGRDSATGSRT